MAEPAPRKVLLATDLGEDSLRALQWSIENVSKGRRDCYIVVHVAKLRDETPTIHHGPVGTSFRFREATREQTEAELAAVRQRIRTEVLPLLDAAGLPHETHLILEGENAPAADVAALIEGVAQQQRADLIVASRSNKTWTQRWFLGSVAERLASLPFPLILVTTTPAEAS